MSERACSESEFCGLTGCDQHTVDAVHAAAELDVSGCSAVVAEQAYEALETCAMMGCAHHRDWTFERSLLARIADKIYEL